MSISHRYSAFCSLPL